MRIRSARNDDWKECLTLDGSYETSTAWQMEEQRSENEWRVSFREVNLPRTQHVRRTQSQPLRSLHPRPGRSHSSLERYRTMKAIHTLTSGVRVPEGDRVRPRNR